jgi:hypothetical protein
MINMGFVNASQRHHHGKRWHLTTAPSLAFGIIASLSCTPKADAQTASGLI